LNQQIAQRICLQFYEPSDPQALGNQLLRAKSPYKRARSANHLLANLSGLLVESDLSDSAHMPLIFTEGLCDENLD